MLTYWFTCERMEKQAMLFFPPVRKVDGQTRETNKRIKKIVQVTWLATAKRMLHFTWNLTVRRNPLIMTLMIYIGFVFHSSLNTTFSSPLAYSALSYLWTPILKWLLLQALLYCVQSFHTFVLFSQSANKCFERCLCIFGTQGQDIAFHNNP